MNAQHHPDTPRTNSVRIGPDHKHKYWEDFARELERELAASQERVKKAFLVGKEDWEGENAKLREEIAALKRGTPLFTDRMSGAYDPHERQEMGG